MNFENSISIFFQYGARNRKEYYLQILQPPYPKDKSIETFTTNRTLTLASLRNLIESYSATLNHRSEHGDKKTNDLITKCISNIGKALGKSNEMEASVHVDVSNEFFMVLCRKPK